MSSTLISTIDIVNLHYIYVGKMNWSWNNFLIYLYAQFSNRLIIPSGFLLMIITGAPFNTIINMFLLFINIFNKTAIWTLNLAIGILMLKIIFGSYRKNLSLN